MIEIDRKIGRMHQGLTTITTWYQTYAGIACGFEYQTHVGISSIFQISMYFQPLKKTMKFRYHHTIHQKIFYYHPTMQN